jgi:hypothetical protein
LHTALGEHHLSIFDLSAHARTNSNPQHWLLCQKSLYQFEFALWWFSLSVPFHNRRWKNSTRENTPQGP